MERMKVASEAIASIGYDAEADVLEIEFESGEVYQYEAVPQEIYDALMAAESKGSYFQAHIRDHYRYLHIG